MAREGGPTALMRSAAGARPAAAPREPPGHPGPGGREDLLTVTELIEADELTPADEHTHSLADTAEGVRHAEQGHARGKAAVTVV
ncbi:zinc-binding dehydrogenase [Streptomyces sp. NPDC127091]|uniref:zinc-binding dehydrogenase n=1 Tax=Streptomyces sp. NPDC127091 TaxID=3347134 RepID=UPI00364681E4